MSAVSWMVRVLAPLALGATFYRVGTPRAGWIRGTAPDALWTFALTSTIVLLWGGSASPARYGWIAAALAVAVGHEFAQLAQVIPGTFDVRDVVASVLG